LRGDCFDLNVYNDLGVGYRWFWVEYLLLWILGDDGYLQKDEFFLHPNRFFLHPNKKISYRNYPYMTTG